MKNNKNALPSSGDMAILTDVDLTLLPSMCTKSTPEQKALVSELHAELEGAFALVTGRPASSVDKAFPAKLPASVEHHSAIRTVRGGEFSPLAPVVNVKDFADMVREGLKNKVRLFDDPSEVQGGSYGVFIEQKQFSMALVFTAHAATPKDKDILDKAARAVMDAYKLDATHRIAHSTDSTEIVPKGLNKGVSVRDFMKDPAFSNRVPVFLGDSGTDAVAMEVCQREFGGTGIAIGKTIPDAPYVAIRLASVQEAWEFLNDIRREAKSGRNGSGQFAVPGAIANGNSAQQGLGRTGT